MAVQIHDAQDSDASAVAATFIASLETLDFLPELYTDGEKRRFIEQQIFGSCEVLVAKNAKTTSDQRILGFLALDQDEIHLLYVAPDHWSQSVGRRLVDEAKTRRPSGLTLWCFQANRRARAFYEKNGFVIAEQTAGDRNEERLPDMRYVWPAP
ncbi:MAG: GNAT family N-acetyltransferase [Alphaproteobacteria bacterium]|nr:GNAT family N-acetyltransferase [Alphaproteobacteria bacterium]